LRDFAKYLKLTVLTEVTENNSQKPTRSSIKKEASVTWLRF